MMLKRGSTGGDVRTLQRKLGIKDDGDFGGKTEKAVIDWQKQHGLTPDGVITSANSSWSLFFGDTELPPMPPASELLTNLRIDALKGHIPDAVLAQITEAAAKFGIINNLRLAHFLSQCAHESGNFSAVAENLNYSAKGLLSTFGKYFNATTAAQYAKKPMMIASRVYADRMGNGNEASQEGWKYRGRGYIQLTGKTNYDKFSAFIGADCIANPDLVATKYPLASAAFFFNSNKLWSICDKGATAADVTAVTKRVNGGTNGLEDRLKHFNLYWSLLK